MSESQNVERMTIYYQEFHHKCLSWYITVMGFFIVGVIAAPQASAILVGKIFGLLLIAVSLACGGLFFACIAHYGARIKILTQWLEGDPEAIPTDWRASHKNAGWEIHGVGSAFFFAILIGMQVTLVLLILLRYWN